MPDASATATVLIASSAALVLLAACHLWYAWGVSRVLGAHGAPTWRAWVPLLGEAELFRLGRIDPVRAVLLLVPFVAVYGFVLRVAAVHRIGTAYGRGIGMTVLGALLPPVWATVLAGAQPVAAATPGEDAEGDEGAPELAVPPTDAAPALDPAAAMVSPLGAVPDAAPAVPAPAASAPSLSAPGPITHVPGPAAPAASPAAPAASPAAPAPAAAPAPPAPAASPADDLEDSTNVVRGVREWELVLPDGRAVVLVAPVVVLGRRPVAPDASIQAVAVPDQTRTVSKQHARLAWSDGNWTVTDLGSTNGVSVLTGDGAEREVGPGTPAPVGDAFLLGECRLEMRRVGV
ncbi:FHA domain-containing protein [Microbacterium sp. zg-Y625]|uniref:FHA domain-containing protein n=3 Tax=Microbacterium jiangjiandongii TaxID=3049071 RepID=UPI00254E7027|nr:FHA domain-containing protein [Microbacterium sp. zg-Y625]WIM25597.1 FHA domain-containing protein [Microbacterium sp. zg-Y625]